MDGYTGKIAPDGHPIQVLELRNANGMRVGMMDWGATWLSCQVPVPASISAPISPPISAPSPTQDSTQEFSLREVLLRSPNFEAHLEQKAYFGATVGRYANRIAYAQFPLGFSSEQRVVQLLANDAENCLHGGPEGFDAQRWQVDDYSLTKVVFRLQSADGDQGFPGNLEVRATYELRSDNTLVASFDASIDKVCPVNITNHAYFNLAPEHRSVLEHKLQVAADKFVPVLATGIPSAGPTSVVGSSFDFRLGKVIGQDLLACPEQQQVAGYDHALVLDTQAASGRVPAATLVAPDASLQMQITTTKPGLQLYTGNFLAGTAGANGSPYRVHAGVALETAFLPDAPNHPEWQQPSCLLQPGAVYAHQTLFRFS